MKAIIEKELCNPVDGQIVGPMYHVYGVSESGSKELIETIDGDIKEAARLAERTIDLSELEVAYKKDPAAFQSTVYPTPLDNVLSLESKHKSEADMLYKDIDMCIRDLIDARITHNEHLESECIMRMETLMVQTQQYLSFEKQNV